MSTARWNPKETAGKALPDEQESHTRRLRLTRTANLFKTRYLERKDGACLLRRSA